MCRHKGIGMNKPKKKQVSVPSLAEVRLKLSGYVAEPMPEPTSAAAHHQAVSCGMQLVKDLERYAWLKGKDAERAREVYGAQIAQHRVDERIRNACWRRLEARKPSTKFSVLEKREYKMNELIRQWLFSEFELAAVGQANAEAHVESLMFKCVAKDAKIRLLERQLQRQKKS